MTQELFEKIVDNHSVDRAALTKGDVAALLNYRSIRSVENLMRSGGLPFYRIGQGRVYFKYRDILLFLERYRHQRGSRQRTRYSAKLNRAAAACAPSPASPARTSPPPA